MGLFQAIPESFLVLKLLLLCFTPLLPFLCFELIDNLKNDKNDDDDDFDDGINILSLQSLKSTKNILYSNSRNNLTWKSFGIKVINMIIAI